MIFIRSPDETCPTVPLRVLFAHMKDGFHHSGRFATLMDVVNHFLSLHRSFRKRKELGCSRRSSASAVFVIFDADHTENNSDEIHLQITTPF